MLRSVRLTILLFVLGVGALAWQKVANPIYADTEADLARTFTQTVRPFLAAYCTGCHSGPAPEASFDLQRYATLESVVAAIGRLCSANLRPGKCPPRS
jgi:hypothetical protein